MTDPGRVPLLTLEPFIDAVREGVEATGWELSGLQKTTSHQFEGRWEGDSSRSAYLFFHPPDGPGWASVDVFLDETSKGLTGNVALVVDLEPLGELGDVHEVLSVLGRLSTEFLPRGYRRPVTLRFRLEDGGQGPGEADAEARFKLRFPKSALEAGASAVAALTSSSVRSLQELMMSSDLRPYLDGG